MVIVCITGYSGVGKSTQRRILKEKLEKHFPGRAVLLSASGTIKENEDSRPEVRKQRLAGEMVDDSLTWQWLQEKISRLPSKTELVIIEGFLRTGKAARISVNKIDKMIVLDADIETQRQRLYMQQAEGARDDKTDEAIQRQLGLRSRMEAAIRIFEEYGKCCRVDASASIDVVADQIWSEITTYLVADIN